MLNITGKSVVTVIITYYFLCKSVDEIFSWSETSNTLAERRTIKHDPCILMVIIQSFPDQKPGEIEENEEETFTDGQENVGTKIS